MIDIYCNDTFLHFENIPYYNDEVWIDLNITCQKNKNRLILFCHSPRTNIDCILYCSEFQFSEEIDDRTDGQIVSQMVVNYNLENPETSFEYNQIVIMTHGNTLSGIVMNMPINDRTFLRELVYRTYTKVCKECPICYETKSNCVAVHDDHHFCLDCILKCKQKLCPLCRASIV